MIRCTKCNFEIDKSNYNISEFINCELCDTPVLVEIFPAFFRKTQISLPGESIVIEKESSCFYHNDKKAAVVCSACGRFLCSLCDMEFNDRHLCPACLETGGEKRKIKSIENNRTMYDTIALFLAAFPIFTFYFTIICAPVSLFMAIRYWKAPSSIIKRTKIRFIIAIILSLGQIAGWIALIGFIIYGLTQI